MDEAHGTVSTATVTEHLVSTELAMLAMESLVFAAICIRERNQLLVIIAWGSILNETSCFP